MTASRSFWDWTEWDGSCLLWTGAVSRAGYGKVTHNTKTWSAHRLAYVAYYDCQPSSALAVMHLCNTPLCCNPLHLQLGTPRENSHQAMRQGRLCAGKRHSRPVAKLTWESVREIRTLRGKLSQAEIAEKFGVIPSNISRILGGETWREEI